MSKIKLVGRVLSLFVSEKGNSERISKERITLDTQGILGDKFYAKDMERSVLLTTQESYTLALNHKIEMDAGSLGENILIDYTPYHLELGTQLKIGNVIFEIAQNCTICNHLSSIDKKLPTLLKDDRGIFIKVVKEGKVKVGDLVYLMNK